MKVDITVFTATYNRADTIKRLYDSLLNQSIKSFEWIIVDDGSVDNTKEMIEQWMEIDSNDFSIKYVYQDNGGKHRAVNKGLEMANGELFFIVDSDDYLINTAIEKTLYWKKTLSNRKNYAGIAGLKGFDIGTIIGQTFNQSDYLDCTSLERRRYGILGDKAEIFFTDVLKCYKFPEFVGEKFITEAVVWNIIAFDGLVIRWFNEIIYISEEYRADGLTAMGDSKFLENWEGYSLYVNQELRFRKNIFRKLNLIMLYARMAKNKGQNIAISSKKIGCNYITLKICYTFCGFYYRLINFIMK